MADQPIFSVTISDDVKICRIKPKSAEYAAAKQDVIFRERDAIKLFHQLKEASDGAGDYSFQSLENARTFAFLWLKLLQQGVENNLDRIQDYDGKSASSTG